MGAGGTNVRCPHCGRGIRAVLAATPATQWFPCPHCRRPVAIPTARAQPPLYTWEVVPGLYPAFVPPKRPRVRTSTAAAIVLVFVVTASFATAGASVLYGLAAQHGNPTYTISGIAVVDYPNGTSRYASGVTVSLRGEGGYSQFVTAGLGGQFQFLGVPAGGVNLSANGSGSGWGSGWLTTFASPVYSATTAGVVLGLSPALGDAPEATVLSPFPTMESLVATLDGAAVVAVLGGAVAAYAVVVVPRRDGAVAGVLGGGAGLGLVGIVFFLGLATPFPWLSLGSSIAGGAGAFVVAVEAAILARGPAPVAPS